jgi:uncharacterized phage protein (TIGR01671 family)
LGVVGVMENKFKVWCKDKNEWEKDYSLIDQHGNLCRVEISGCIVNYKPENHIAVFYTGLKDKNSVEIYEGDELIYISTGQSSMVVEFKDGCFVGVGPFNTLPLCEYIDADDFVSIEIIGNIYENPELIENKDT